MEFGEIMQTNPLRMHEILRHRARGARGPVQIQPFRNQQYRDDGRVVTGIRGLAHQGTKRGGGLRIRDFFTLLLGNPECFKGIQEVGVFIARNLADEL